MTGSDKDVEGNGTSPELDYSVDKSFELSPRFMGCSD